MSDPILVTGAAGFVGGHLLALLGDEAVACEADVTDGHALAQAVGDVRPAAVVHLAARSSVGESWDGAADVWAVNAIGTVNVLGAVAAERPDARVLVASTAEVYGPTDGAPAREDDPIAPVSPYAASKAAAEIAAARAARADGLDVVVARSFPHVGPGQHERFAIGSWTRQIARLEAEGGGDLAVGNLDVVRDLTDVRDVCRAYALLLRRSLGPGVYNVASGKGVRLAHVVELLVGMSDAPIRVRQDPARLRTSDVPRLVGDASRLRDATGWQPTLALERTLADALGAARETLARGEAVNA